MYQTQIDRFEIFTFQLIHINAEYLLDKTLPKIDLNFLVHQLNFYWQWKCQLCISLQRAHDAWNPILVVPHEGAATALTIASGPLSCWVPKRRQQWREIQQTYRWSSTINFPVLASSCLLKFHFRIVIRSHCQNCNVSVIFVLNRVGLYIIEHGCCFYRSHL